MRSQHDDEMSEKTGKDWDHPQGWYGNPTLTLKQMLQILKIHDEDPDIEQSYQ